MCLRPITIPNRRYDFRPGIDKLYLTVPCNECAECRSNKINEYFVRLYYEWQRYYYNRGSVWFVTLSYNELDLPYIDVHSAESRAIEKVYGMKFPNISYPCFDKGHVRDFLDRLLKLDRLPYFITKNIPSLRDANGVPYNTVLGADIKHFCVCEYGHTTHRPHYHLLIFCPFIASAGAMKKLFEFCWSSRKHSDDVPEFVKRGLCTAIADGKDNFECHEWFAYKTVTPRKTLTYYMHKHGFAMFSYKHGAQVLNPIGCKYLCKYLFKDEHFFGQPFANEYADIIKSLPALAGIPETPLKKMVHHAKDTLPFFLISNGFGADLEKEFDTTSLAGAKQLLDAKVSVPGDTHLYAVPQYIIRRLCTENRHYAKLDGVPESRYLVISYITDFGKKCLDYKLQKNKELFFRRFKHLTLNANKIFKINDSLEKYDKYYDCTKFLDLIGTIDIDTLEKLYLYVTFLRNVDANFSDLNYYYELPELRELCAALYSLDISTRNDHPLEFFGKYVTREPRNVTSTGILWNDNVTFKDFDLILSGLDLLESVLRGSYLNDKMNNDKLNGDWKYHLLSLIYYNN